MSGSGIILPGDDNLRNGLNVGGRKVRKATPREVIEARLQVCEQTIQTLTEMQLATEAILRVILPDFEADDYYAVCAAVHEARTTHQDDQAKGRALIEAAIAQRFPYKLAKEELPMGEDSSSPSGD